MTLNNCTLRISDREALLASKRCNVLSFTHLDGTADEWSSTGRLDQPGEEVGRRGAQVNELHHAARQIHHALVDVATTQRLVAPVQPAGEGVVGRQTETQADTQTHGYLKKLLDIHIQTDT